MGKLERKGEAVIYAERCIKCELGYMVHTTLYTWRCSRCGYEYVIDPNAPYGKADIRETVMKVD